MQMLTNKCKAYHRHVQRLTPGEEDFHAEWIAERDNQRCLYLNIPLRRQKETRLAFGDCRSIANGHIFEEDTL